MNESSATEESTETKMIILIHLVTGNEIISTITPK